MLDDGFLEVWTHLVEAMHGKASHGSDAEIYAYVLKRHSPALECGMLSESAAQKYRKDACIAAKRRLVDICRNFERITEAKVLIEDGSIDEFERSEILYDHCVMVSVIG